VVKKHILLVDAAVNMLFIYKREDALLVDLGKQVKLDITTGLRTNKQFIVKNFIFSLFSLII
jgi:hypothetical protein